MTKNIVISIGIICSCFSLLSQEQEQAVDEMTVNYIRLRHFNVDSLHVYIDREEIEALQPYDLGEILKKVPGTNIKSYGGLGGLKTVSIRGLGSQHTNFVIDGFSQFNTQTGQINASQIQTDNIEKIIVQRGGSSELMIPVSAQLSSNTIVIETFQATKPNIPLQNRLFSKFGSFGLNDQDFIAKTGSEKFYGGLNVKYRTANGRYPYEFKNYQTTLKGSRTNNDFMDLNAGVNLHYAIHKKHRLNAYFQYFQADQGLPGAIVLYNDNSKQRLLSTTNQFKIDYQGSVKELNYRIYWNYLKDSIYYFDPNYLNEAGELKSTFITRSNDFGGVFHFAVGKKLHFNLGSEEIVSRLRSRESLIASPERWQNFSYLKGTFALNNFLFIAQIGHQYIQETNKNGETSVPISKFSPYAEIRKEFNELISATVYYRNSFRPPSFNELYYNSVGNTNLKPENANQLGMGSSFKLLNKKRAYIGIQLNAYYSLVDNLILAIPTKNLFVWSIQNVGKNEIYGLDGIVSLSFQLAKNWSSSITANYTYQESLDITDKNSPTYRNQVAYVPVHTGNTDLTIQFKGLGIRASGFLSSERYALNQNIKSNLIQGYELIDISVYSIHKLDNNNKIRLQITMKNILNEQYAVIRSFVMPGRNFLISFRYEFS